MGHFLGQPNERSPRLERFAAQQAWQSDLLGKSQKNWAVAVDPAVSLSTYSTLPMEVVPWSHWPRRAKSTKAVDDGEAEEGDDAEPGKTR